jgi:calcineurin-like phosphoesterase family protein
MNETMIERWNSRVKKGDRVYHLGDVALGRPSEAAEILARLNGQIFLVRGNHEAVAEHKLCRDRFVWIKDYFGLKVGDQKIYLCHYAFRTWNCEHHGSWHLR